MKSYYVAGLDDSSAYCKFIEYMWSRSSAFSLVYFRYNSSEKMKKTCRSVKTQLEPYKIFEKNVLKWPSMETLNANTHIYRLAMYRSTAEAKNVLLQAGSLWDWDYPLLPMDLCFYRDGYAWFAASSHETWNALYIDDKSIAAEMKALGFELTDEEDVRDGNIFYEESLRKERRK